MRSELGIIQVLDGILHVIIANEFANSSAILEHIGIAYVARDTHMILDILPATSWW